MSMTNWTQGRRSLLHRSWAFICILSILLLRRILSFKEPGIQYCTYCILLLVSYIYSILFVQKEILHQVGLQYSCDATRSCLRKPWPSCFEGDESVQKSIDPQIFQLWGCCSTACVGIAMTFFILFQSFSYIFYFLFALFLIVFLHITLVYLPCPIPW